MSFALIRCQKCGKITFCNNAAHKRIDCSNTQTCHNKIWIEEQNQIKLKFGTDFIPESNTAHVFINVFNNHCYLAARVYAHDAKNFLVIPINERYVGITRKDTIAAIPAEMKHSTSYDGLLIQSGCYPVSPEMETEIKKNIYIREKRVEG
jgi:hypothetical protein